MHTSTGVPQLNDNRKVEPLRRARQIRDLILHQRSCILYR